MPLGAARLRARHDHARAVDGLGGTRGAGEVELQGQHPTAGLPRERPGLLRVPAGDEHAPVEEALGQQGADRALTAP